MNIINKENIESIIKNGYYFDFKKSFSSGYEIFKKNVGLFVICSIILFFGFFLLPISLIVIIFITSFNINSGFQDIFNSSGIMIFFIVLFLLVIIFLMFVPILLFGFNIIAYKLDKNLNPKFSTFFEGFYKIINFMKLGFLYIIIHLILYSIIFIPIIYIYEGTYSFIDSFFMSFQKQIMYYVISNLIFTLLNASISFASFFIYFGGFKVTESLKYSFGIIKHNFIQLGLYFFVIQFIASIGIYLFGLGILFTLPLFFCLQYSAISQIIFNSQSEIDLIGKD